MENHNDIDLVTAKVVEAVVSFLGNDVETVKHDETLHTLGFDSLDEVDLIMELENEFDIEISDEERVEHFKTVNTITNFLVARLA